MWQPRGGSESLCLGESVLAVISKVLKMVQNFQNMYEPGMIKTLLQWKKSLKSKMTNNYKQTM